MMNYTLYSEYRDLFGCRISIVFQTGTRTLCASDGKLYSVEAATDEELDTLMKESIDMGRNVLLENFKGQEYTFESNPDYDY